MSVWQRPMISPSLQRHAHSKGCVEDSPGNSNERTSRTSSQNGEFHCFSISGPLPRESLVREVPRNASLRTVEVGHHQHKVLMLFGFIAWLSKLDVAQASEIQPPPACFAESPFLPVTKLQSAGGLVSILFKKRSGAAGWTSTTLWKSGPSMKKQPMFVFHIYIADYRAKESNSWERRTKICNTLTLGRSPPGIESQIYVGYVGCFSHKAWEMRFPLSVEIMQCLLTSGTSWQGQSEFTHARWHPNTCKKYSQSKLVSHLYKHFWKRMTHPCKWLTQIVV